MENSRAAAAVAALLLALLVNQNPWIVDDAFEKYRNIPDEDDDILVGLQPKESWLVLRVSFPNIPFQNNLVPALFEGEYSAQSYIEQMSGGHSYLDYTVMDDIWESPSNEDHWGKDTAEGRDMGGASGGASQLAVEAIHGLLTGFDASPWDLDGDGTVDRILILHSGQAQESGASSSTIWSHFSAFQDEINLGNHTYEHYTMASIHSGLGVVVHEMLHQMGAVDLYDVHSETPSRKWNGLGDWDVMASGNWIDDGNRPSLPSASTLNLIGAFSNDSINPLTDVTDTFTESVNFTLAPITEGGAPLRLEIAPGEYIWITFRSDSGFDSALPGHGILVEQQDTNFGDIGANLVNTDPSTAWAKIIEADGDDALIRARDYGSQGDVFTVGDQFGSSGHQIRDNHGRLVRWSIIINNVSDNIAQMQFIPDGDSVAHVMTPRSPVVLLPGETATASIHLEQSCTLVTNLSIDSNEGIQTVNNSQYIEYETLATVHEVLILDTNLIDGTSGRISGTIGCDGLPQYDLSLDWHVISHRLSSTTLMVTVPWTEPSTVNLYPVSEGSGGMTYSISIDGAADRVATVVSQGLYLPGDPIELEINPSGLLEPGMIARGELVFVDSNKIEHRIPFILETEPDFPFSETLGWMALPSNAFTVICVLLAVSIAAGGRQE